jgi:signal transduction histidine kinase/ActR/RegA family two-component response regulator
MRYGAACGFVLAAFAVKQLFARQLGPGSPFLLLPFSALLAAWFGGLGPGLLATLLSAVLANQFFLDAVDTPRDRTFQLAVFVLQGVVISLMAHLLGRAREQVGEARGHAQAADRQRLRALENVSDSFFSLDSEWRIVHANRNFLARYSRGSEAIGRSLWDLYPELAGTEMEARYRRAMATRVPDVVEMRSYISSRWFRVVMEPNEDGGLSVSATDFSELKATEEGLRAAKEDAERARAEAEEANRVKDQFLATLSHELRTPVNAIAGWTQILRSGQLDPEKTARALDVIERNARVQAQLIDDLLDISRVISGKLRLETLPVWPAEIVEAAVAAVLPAAGSKDIRVERALDSGAGPVLADPDRLQQVVGNLLGNAVKFTPRGGRVEVRLEERGGEVRLQVSDSGQGIESDLLPQVFDSFWQADASTTRHQGGLGLGLAIVRQLVELHGGHVEAASDGKGRGATFTVTLPLLQPQREAETPGASARPAPASGTGSPPLLAGLRLLVVEDYEATLDALTELLSLQGAIVAPAASVEQALMVLAKLTPDVLVSDIGMPERDGYDLIRAVRALGRTAETLPAVAVTAFASPEDRQRALTAGFQLHLAKPVDPRELIRVIASLAGREVGKAG